MHDQQESLDSSMAQIVDGDSDGDTVTMAMALKYTRKNAVNMLLFSKYISYVSQCNLTSHQQRTLEASIYAEINRR